MLAGDALPAGFGFLRGAKPFVFVADPTHHVGVDARQQRSPRGALERPEVLHPSPRDGVDLSGDLGEGIADSAVQPAWPGQSTALRSRTVSPLTSRISACR